MLTRCPHCQTVFRVTSEQLTLRQGRVRCGECREVFNALESLADEVVAPPVAAPSLPAAPPEEASPAEASVEPPPPVAEEAADVPPAGPAPEPEQEAAAEESPPPQDGETNEAPAALGAQEAAETAAAAPEPLEDAPPAETADQDDAAALPEAWEEEAPARPPRRWPWALGALLLLLLAAGQLLHFYRAELAVRVPELRPALLAACAALDCTLPRPRQPELVGIDSSDLAPEGGERLLLTATLRNRAPFAQDYPHLELTLTDTRDNAIVRKVLAPADWLPPGQTEADGFAPQGEIAVKLLLEAKGVPAVGYRLYLFYP